MDIKMRSFKSLNHKSKEAVEDIDVRKGPWMAEEDKILFNYINSHGEGRWNAVARCTGLKRTGKSCRLRWLNYLRPSVRRGNITLQEQLLILELHFRWGNRWSKIAQYLPGRTDNEIKNYWRTRVQKQAKQLKCDVNSKQFRDAMRYVWMPRLFERIQASTTTTTPGSESNSATDQPPPHLDTTNGSGWVNQDIVPSPSYESISNRVQISPVSNITEFYDPVDQGDKMERPGMGMVMEQGYDREVMNGWTGGGESLDSWWNEEDLYWFLQQQIGEWNDD